MRNPEQQRKTNRELANELLAARAILQAIAGSVNGEKVDKRVLGNIAEIMDEAAGRLRKAPNVYDLMAQTRAAINATLDEEIGRWGV